MPRLAKFDLRARDEMVERLGSALDLPLPATPLTSAVDERLTVLWLGPDQWLWLGPEGSEGVWHGRLEGAIEGGFAAVTDVTHQLVGLELGGRGARDVLAAGCRLDLHPTALPVGFASRTLVAKTEVVLHRRVDDGADPVFWLLVRRSFADYLWRWLVGAGREVGLGRGV